MKRLVLILTIAVLPSIVSGISLAQSNPFIGTWKLNTVKSRYSPGPGPQSVTRTFEAKAMR
jgi:hypothetical protein